MDNVFISSFIAGSFQTLMGHPLDTVKTRIQLNNKNGLYLITQLIKNEGIMSLYKGASLPLLGGCVQNAVLFSTEHHILNICNNNHYYSGFISGFCSSFIMCPVELIKCKFQSNTNKLYFKNIYDSFKIKHMSFYNGLFMTIVRDSFGFSIYFGSYNYLQYYNNNPLINGGIAGIFSWIYSYPFDVIKTIQQTNDLKFLDVYNTIKPKQYIKGIHTVLIRSFLVNAGIFYLFENIKTNI
jgi:solute carrier family 25 carnitine/acylcarnitine transporter 20/29|tara:strand:- start:2156 stop:2872 length:717 start_codon:yes stop_codon:yes gene_type:complete